MDIQTIHIDSEDTILCQLNEDLDLSNYKMIIKEFEKIFPKNNILFTNNSIKKIIILKRNNLLEDILNKPLEELYPELFNKGIEL